MKVIIESDREFLNGTCEISKVIEYPCKVVGKAGHPIAKPGRYEERKIYKSQVATTGYEKYRVIPINDGKRDKYLLVAPDIRIGKYYPGDSLEAGKQAFSLKPNAQYMTTYNRRSGTLKSPDGQ